MAAEDEFSYANGYLSASYVFKDDVGDYCGVGEGIYPYERSGTGLQYIDDGISYAIGEGVIGGLPIAVYGYASGDVKTYVNASTQEIKTYNHMHNSGIGPDYRMIGPIKLNWSSSGWGASRSQGYYYNVIHVEPGTSGLEYGDAVELDLGIALDGSIVMGSYGDYEANSYVFARTQIADITDFDTDYMNEDILPWRSSQFLSGGEGIDEVSENALANIEAELDTDFFIAADNSIAYDSGAYTVSATVGDWLLLETYMLTGVSLPNHSDAFSISATADFFNTMNTSLLPGEGFAGIELAHRDFGSTLVPEPVSCVLFPIGLTLFGLARRKK
jgi:hypothetical protein